MDFHPVEANLRQSFRVLAVGRPGGDARELPGITLASLGVAFQMFNAAFFNSSISTAQELEERLTRASDHFRARRLRWALWVCEDWLEPSVRRRLSQTCEKFGLRLSSDMPGMLARVPPRGLKRPLPQLDYRRVDSRRTLDDFRGIGSVCFHVPLQWFSEVFDESVPAERPGFTCWVAYLDGLPVATAASVPSEEAIGLYNIATAPEHRGRGFAEAITRHVIEAAGTGERSKPFVLQSTPQGFRLYERLGFDTVTRILVYNSTQ